MLHDNINLWDRWGSGHSVVWNQSTISLVGRAQDTQS